MTGFDIKSIIRKLEMQGIDEKIIAYITLQFTAGLRISDLLKIDYRNISSNLIISIEQSKGSDLLITHPVYFRDTWEIIRINKLSPLRYYDRFWFYKLYKKIGITYNNGIGRNASVTHAPRKILAQELYNNTADIEVAKKALGHKSANSTKYYINPEYRKSVLDRGITDASTAKLDPVVMQKNGVIRITRIKK